MPSLLGLPPEDQLRRMEKIIRDVDERVRKQIRSDAK